jgi:hypothetical protein
MLCTFSCAASRVHCGGCVLGDMVVSWTHLTTGEGVIVKISSKAPLDSMAATMRTVCVIHQPTPVETCRRAAASPTVIVALTFSQSKLLGGVLRCALNGTHNAQAASRSCCILTCSPLTCRWPPLLLDVNRVP